MKKHKKTLFKIFIVTLIVIAVAGIAHYFVFPQQSKCILIDFSSFKKEGRLYYNNHTPSAKITALKEVIQKSTLRVSDFWGQKTCDPKFIYCDTDDDFIKYGSPQLSPAVTMAKLGIYIVISNQGIDVDVIAHELSHAEFYERIGFYNRTFKIPVWFDEGLAMQVDDRNYYSDDTLKARSDNFKNLPDVKKLVSPALFNAGTIDEVMLNYMTAKHEIKSWYTKEKLETFIEKLNSGESFEKAME